MSVRRFPRPLVLTPVESSISSGLLRRGAQVLGGSLLVAAGAHVAVPLGFTPVPFTLQTLAVLLIGLLLGPSMAFGALLLYLLEGASGLPVFSPAGPGGLFQLLGPTGGFLFSYPAAAALTGLSYAHFTKRCSRWLAGALAGSIGTGLILAVGALWLATEMHLAASAAFAGAVLPFLPGEAVKICAAAGIAAALHLPISRARKDF